MPDLLYHVPSCLLFVPAAVPVGWGSYAVFPCTVAFFLLSVAAWMGEPRKLESQDYSARMMHPPPSCGHWVPGSNIVVCFDPLDLIYQNGIGPSSFIACTLFLDTAVLVVMIKSILSWESLWCRELGRRAGSVLKWASGRQPDNCRRGCS